MTIHKTSASRRNFLLGIISSLGLVVIAAISNVVIRYLLPPAKMKKTGELTIPTAQIPIGSSLIVDYKGSPVIVVNTGEKFVAFSATCTHLGCIVKWLGNEKKFFCPCHAGKFDATGKVLAGPPPEPLHPVDIEIINDTITFA